MNDNEVVAYFSDPNNSTQELILTDRKLEYSQVRCMLKGVSDNPMCSLFILEDLAFWDKLLNDFPCSLEKIAHLFNFVVRTDQPYILKDYIRKYPGAVSYRLTIFSELIKDIKCEKQLAFSNKILLVLDNS
jgi:hypothetical protein